MTIKKGIKPKDMPQTIFDFLIESGKKSENLDEVWLYLDGRRSPSDMIDTLLKNATKESLDGSREYTNPFGDDIKPIPIYYKEGETND